MKKIGNNQKGLRKRNMIQEKGKSENKDTNKDMQASPLYEAAYQIESRSSNVRFFTVLLLIMFLFFVFRGIFVSSFARIDVDGSSMYPTLQDGDRLFMRFTAENDAAGGFLCYPRTAKRGEVVIVDVRKYHDTKTYSDIVAVPFINRTGGGLETVNFLVKRLVGVPGDTIKEENGIIYYLSAEQKGKGSTEFTPLENQPENVSFALEGCVYELGENEILVLGDNTYNSIDGRWQQKDVAGNPRSHLKCAYKVSDICGIVPNWAVKGKSFSTGYYELTGKINSLFQK